MRTVHTHWGYVEGTFRLDMDKRSTWRWMPPCPARTATDEAGSRPEIAKQ
ncbi:hypothetical protein [Kitasatospora atroaurantiaca]|nr:hypothetical protein [Kitasatospora atroaurantiaca]